MAHCNLPRSSPFLGETKLRGMDLDLLPYIPYIPRFMPSLGRKHFWGYASATTPSSLLLFALLGRKMFWGYASVCDYPLRSSHLTRVKISSPLYLKSNTTLRGLETLKLPQRVRVEPSGVDRICVWGETFFRRSVSPCPPPPLPLKIRERSERKIFLTPPLNLSGVHQN